MTNSRSSPKGKERDVFDSLDSGSFTSTLAFDDMLSFANKPPRGTPLSRPSTADPLTTGQRRQRTSILGVASDALRFGRRRRSIKTPPPPPQPRLLLPDVIEVRAAAPTPSFDEDEEAEREQLRAAAVQSVGFDVDISRSPDREQSVFGEEPDMNEGIGRVIQANGHQHRRSSPPILEPSLPSAVDGTVSDGPESPHTVRQRVRASSPCPVRSPQPPSSTFTSPSTEIPAFPSTRAQVSRHEQLSATLPKHYPPPSLLMLALSKQWKSRHVVLSAPVVAGALYLHVFKSSASDEPELERLEINEHSVVFITDGDVGGRRGVVRVGGFDVGALRRELNSEENGMTMMMLQILDASVSQSWINAIKSAVLGQRSVRAGLGIPSSPSGVPEPLGDLDVMLSMRMQEMLSSPTKPFKGPDKHEDASKVKQAVSSTEDVSSPPKSPSLRSRPASPRAANAVLSLKSLFSVSGSGSARPRSPPLSRATSPDAASGESFASAASSLLSMRTVADSPLIKPYSMLPPSGPGLDTTIQIPRKIIDTQSNLDWTPLESSKPAVTILSPPRPMSPSLNPPPPRKRAYTTNEPRSTASSDAGQLVYNHGNASSAGSFGVLVPESAHPRMERASSERSKPRTSSVSSASTMTENGSARRWSRQSSIPPHTPPPSDSSTPPASSVSQPLQNSSPLALPSYVPERTPSPSSQSQRTLPSIMSSLHGSSKRASVSSSMYSVATSSSAQQVGTFTVARGGGHRLSVPPPPRPAPSTALPPTPTGSDTECPVTATVKGARRNSLARRALRLSLGPPTPSIQAQAHILCNADDRTSTSSVSRSHSRSTSVDSMPRSSLSHGRVIPSALLEPPSPPPTCPLPPPPPSPTSSVTQTPTPASPRTTTFKQRLRIRSVPSSGRSTPPPPAISTVLPPTLTPLQIPTSSTPVTPIGERIAHISPDSDFLHLDGDTPVASTPWAALGTSHSQSERHLQLQQQQQQGDAAPVLSILSTPPRPLPPPRTPSMPPPPPPPGAPDRSPQQMTVLSPPPRKGSIRPLPSPSPEQERGPSVIHNGDDVLRLTPPPLDLARNTSTLSLSIVSGVV